MLAPFALAIALAGAPLKDVVVSEQPTHALHLKVGQKLVFSVFGNASTGGTWSVKLPGKPGLQFMAISQVANKPQGIVGQGSDYLISFKAVKKGTFSVKLIYGRSWELSKGAKPWDQRTAKVVVQ